MKWSIIYIYRKKETQNNLGRKKHKTEQKGSNIMKVNLKYVALSGLIIGGIGFLQANKDLEYDFSSVYNSDTNHHNIIIKTETNNSRYNKKCADDLSKHLLDAKITNYDINVVNDGQYELIYYNGNKIK